MKGPGSLRFLSSKNLPMTWRRISLRMLVWAVGGFLSLMAYAAAHAWELTRLGGVFQGQSRDRSTAIQHHVNSSLEALRGLAGLYAATGPVDRDAFTLYAEGVLRHHPEIMGLEWVPRVSAQAREGIESGRHDRVPVEIFEFKEGKRVAAPQRDEYYPVFYLEPLAGNESVLGFDISSDPVRWSAMQRARDTGELTLTGRTRLLQAQEDAFGLLAFVPIYEGGYVPDSVSMRRELLQGYVMAVFRVPQMVELSLVGLRPVGMNFWLYDESAPPQERFLYQHRPRLSKRSAVSDADQPDKRFFWSTMLDVGGRLWTLQSYATRDFFAMNRTRWPAGALLIGLLLTGLLAAALENATRRRVEEVLLTARNQLEGRVRERTEELSQVNATLRSSNQQLKHLALQLHSIREDERAGIARELHDELGQALTALKMDLSWVGGRMPEDAEMIRERMRAMTLLIDRMVRTVQQVSASLRPAMLDDFGLLESIRWEAAEFSRRTGALCSLDIRIDRLDFDREQTTAFFRIFQEAMTNIARHALASVVSVRLFEADGRLVLEIADDGVGLPAERLNDARAIGLTSMRERALLLNGHVTFISENGKGTTVRLEMPRPAPVSNESKVQA